MHYLIKPTDFSIKDFCEGDERAFNFIFASYYRSVCFFANRLIDEKPVAEDITQEAFIRLWEKHDAFSCQQSIKAFLYVITRNACLNFIKQWQRNKISRQALQRSFIETVEPVPVKLSQSDLMKTILSAIDTLPQECRKVIYLSFIEGVQNKHIATRLGVSIHTIRNQKARGLYLLKKKLDRAVLFN